MVVVPPAPALCAYDPRCGKVFACERQPPRRQDQVTIPFVSAFLNESIYTLDKDGGLIDSLYNLKKSLQRNYWDTSIENLDDIYYEFVDLSEELKNRREDREERLKRLHRSQRRLCGSEVEESRRIDSQPRN